MIHSPFKPEKYLEFLLVLGEHIPQGMRQTGKQDQTNVYRRQIKNLLMMGKRENKLFFLAIKSSKITNWWLNP